MVRLPIRQLNSSQMRQRITNIGNRMAFNVEQKVYFLHSHLVDASSTIIHIYIYIYEL